MGGKRGLLSIHPRIKYCVARLRRGFRQPSDQPTADFLLEYADFLESHLERWLVTTKGDLLPGTPRHYIRLLPTGDPTAPELNPDDATMYLKNLSGPNAFPARNIVDAGFLELVRYGVRAAGEQLIEDSLRVVDASADISIEMALPLPTG